MLFIYTVAFQCTIWSSCLKIQSALCLQQGHHVSLVDCLLHYRAHLYRHEELKTVMMMDVEEARRKKTKDAENERLNNQRIEQLQSVRREAEIQREEEVKRIQKEKERQMARMKKAVEQERELMLKREELRLARQQEEEDRAWRKRELEKARIQTEKAEKVRNILDIQIRQRHEDAAKSVEREKQYWENIQSTWLEATEEEKKIADTKLKVR